jgi:4-diphosphocytidyl-2-C-methyl-D-erythritol kinase
MADWEAPAKINLDLRLRAADSTGRHPLRSLVQTVEWFDVLEVEPGDEDYLEIAGPAADAGIPDGGENLVWKAVEALELDSRPPLFVRLDKQIAAAAGLGGGSSDAAAMLEAVADLLGLPKEAVAGAASRVGADVPLFLTGGTVVLEGYGERVTPVAALAGFAVAIAVPPFEIATADVYQRWDLLDRPLGAEMPSAVLPPTLRPEGPFRNDLTPAALAVRPELADWMSELSQRWGRTVMMSGSGPACFAYFLDEDEAHSAVGEVGEHRAAVAASLRPRGVSPR